MQRLLNQNNNYTNDFNLITNRIKEIKNNILLQCKRCNRNFEDIKLMLVTKGVNSKIIEKLDPVKYGFDFFGENYIQEAEDKLEHLLNNNICDRKYFHFIGHLQKNKVNKAIKFFSSIDSIDSVSLLDYLSKKSSNNIENNIMLEIKTTNEDSKYGFMPEELINEFEYLKTIPGTKINGLMTLGPLNGDEKSIRKSYKIIKDVSEKIKDKYKVKLPYISMGMSNDYNIALEEGSTLLRIGRAIFGR